MAHVFHLSDYLETLLYGMCHMKQDLFHTKCGYGGSVWLYILVLVENYIVL